MCERRERERERECEGERDCATHTLRPLPLLLSSRTCETITTLGYGDIPPVTAGGKVIACFTCMMGMFSFAIPAGVISASFIEVIYKEREKNRAEREAIDFLNYAKVSFFYVPLHFMRILLTI